MESVKLKPPKGTYNCSFALFLQKPIWLPSRWLVFLNDLFFLDALRYFSYDFVQNESRIWILTRMRVAGFHEDARLGRVYLYSVVSVER
jgi:hypothetical protein